MKENKQAKTIIIGGGASGFFAAIQCKYNHPNHDVIILEKSHHILQKVLLSGGGRCNVTHACFDTPTLCSHYPRGAKALRSVFERFNCQDSIDWFESRGIKLKTEADGRMFPISNKAEDIKNCLINTANELGVKIWTQYDISAIHKQADDFVIQSDTHNPLIANKLILATGSNRQGYKLAENLGLSIIKPIPSLFSFKTKDSKLHALQGLSVQKACVSLNLAPKQKQTGPILITHWGLSGPAIIKLSAWQAKSLHDHNYQTSCRINWLATQSQDAIVEKLTHKKQSQAKKYCQARSPFQEIPQRLWAYFCDAASIQAHQTWQSVSKKQSNKLLTILYQQTLSIHGKGPFKEEFVTCGGVDQSCIDFKTMASKQDSNLYVVGELLDCDGITGGFNFQQAWATAWVAGS